MHQGRQQHIRAEAYWSTIRCQRLSFFNNIANEYYSSAASCKET